MSRRALVASMVLLLACDPASTGDAGPGTDAPGADVPGLDAPAEDAGVGADVPTGGSDTGTAPCDETLSPGSDLAAAIDAAPADAVICLADGDYGALNLDLVERTAFVTVRGVTRHGAAVGLMVARSGYVRFQGLTIDGATIRQCAHHVEILDCEFSSGLLVTMRDATCDANLHLLVAGSHFGDLGGALYEGRLSVADDDGPQPDMGLTIRGNTFGPGCASDGIQLAGGVSGVTIGPGNEFSGIVQSGPVHCDMIQFYASGRNNVIDGNWFHDGSVALTHHTAAPSGTRFTNNLVTDVNQIQVGQSEDFTFEHNTIVSVTDVFRFSSGTTGTFRSNLIAGDAAGVDTSADGGCPGCTITHQLCESAGVCPGTMETIATPMFAAGARPTTWAGYLLSPSSPGVGAGHDGLDVGMTFAP